MDNLSLDVFIKTELNYSNWKKILPFLEIYEKNKPEKHKVYWDMLSLCYFTEKLIDENILNRKNNLKNYDEEAEDILLLLEKSIKLTNGKILKSSFNRYNFLYKIENFSNGKKMLERNHVNLSKLEYREYKLAIFIDQQINTNHWNEKEFIIISNKIINKIEELKLKLNVWDKSVDLYSNEKIKLINKSIVCFYAAIKMGLEPSKQTIIESFKFMWSNCKKTDLFEIEMFCKAFINTNVFNNTIAPLKEMKLGIKNFFKNEMIETDNDRFQILAPKESKENILLNFPGFLYENIDIKMQRVKSLKYFGKAVLKEEEKIQLEELSLKEKSPFATKNNKIKI